MTKSKIEWTDEVWNPVTGCTKVSQGCKHCYAETIANRFWATQYPPNEDGSPRKFTDVRLHPERLEDPLKWKKPRRVFVNSMSDLFHESVPDGFIDRIFKKMEQADKHIFQILTKRPAAMNEYMRRRLITLNRPVLSNVWLGVSVEDQATADERIPLLLKTPAEVRFVSYEPALGPVTFDLTIKDGNGAYGYQALTGRHFPFTTEPRYGHHLDWIIMGGESGPGARPMHPDWARSVRDQCQAAGVPFFFKQWGSPTKIKIVINGKLVVHRMLDGHEWNEFPEAK